MGALFPMRFLTLTLAAVTLLSCTNTSDDFDQLSGFLRPGQQQPVARSEPLIRANVPRLQVSFPTTERAGVMLLEGTRDGVDTWLSADGGTLIMQRGMLRGSRGFGQGLLSSDIPEALEFVFSGQEGTAHRFHTYLNGNDETATRTYICHIENRGPRVTTIGGIAVDARLMAEECQSLDQQFQNLYWVSNSDNLIVQSSQWLGDFIGAVNTRVIPQL